MGLHDYQGGRGVRSPLLEPDANGLAAHRTIKILHSLGYADPNDWSDPILVPPGGVDAIAIPAPWMVIMTKIVRLE